jgi:hypothetical protein
MLRVGQRMLLIGSVLVACVSVFHMVCAIVGASAYRALGAGEGMASAAASGALWPAAMTLGLAVVFGLFSLYALSAVGRFRPLPLTRAAIISIGVLFGLRGIAFVPDLIALVRAGDTIAVRNLFYSAVALLIGLFYLVGMVFGMRRNPRAT